jgi:hypothetical protein
MAWPERGAMSAVAGTVRRGQMGACRLGSNSALEFLDHHREGGTGLRTRVNSSAESYCIQPIRGDGVPPVKITRLKAMQAQH